MRTAAEVDEVRAEGVLGEYVAGALLNEFALHPVVLVFFEAYGFGRHHALERQDCAPGSPRIRSSIRARSSVANLASR